MNNTTSEELSGRISVEIKDFSGFTDLCEKHIPGYDRERFEIAAVRVFAGKEFIVTVYAADKLSLKTVRELRYPVKKFKIETLTMQEIFSVVNAFNFTVSVGNYEIEDMDVTNR